jgi:4-amino-4-deoxy-L-arabinose transferase-like glycosyltransferase
MTLHPLTLTPPAGWTAPIEQRHKSGPDWRRIAFWALLALGVIVRFAALGQVPAGLNADEASTGVEALSILHTGMDRWGNRLPVWFPAWGSGMNALYSYLAVPVVALFGLNVTALRAIGAVFGALTLPVTYGAARHYFGRDTALATMAMLALLPWHVMSSRWALDSNLAPFWFTLGLLTIGKALDQGGRWPVTAFLPWAVALYAYPVTLPPAFLSGVAIVVLYWPEIRRAWRVWASGAALAVAIDLPFLLFLAKNQFGLKLPFENALPFSIPMLAATRLSQIDQSASSRIYNNLVFLWNGFRDGAIWHQSANFPPLTGAAPYLILIGVAALFWRCLKARRPHVVLIVALSAAFPILLIPLNLTRLNWFYIPAMMLVANLIVRLAMSDPARAAPLGRLIAAASAVYALIFLGLFYPTYFARYNDEILSLDRNLGNGFRVGLQGALHAEMAFARPDEPVFVDVGAVHPYLYVLFYGFGGIESFQTTRQMRVEDGIYRVSSFGRFYFERGALPPDRGFVFVSRPVAPPCADAEMAPGFAAEGLLWAVGRCPAPLPAPPPTTRQ